MSGESIVSPIFQPILFIVMHLVQFEQRVPARLEPVFLFSPIQGI
jgi:hypothetical protein